MQPRLKLIVLSFCIVQFSLQECINEYVSRFHGLRVVIRSTKCFNVSNFESEYSLIKSRANGPQVPVTITDSNFYTITEKFIGNYNIPKFNINSCDVTTVGEGAFEGAQVSELSLTGNGIINIEAYAFNSSYINTLTLSNNSIAVIDADVFEGLSNLKYLSLDHNQIHSIKGFENLPALTNLDLSHNSPLNLPKPQDFAALENLETIDLSSCDLYILDYNQFTFMKSLRFVNLQNNNLRLLRGANFPETLVTLNARDNRIKKLDDMSNITRLVEFDLSNNSLYEARNFLTNLTSLEKLYLQNARLTDRFYEDGFSGLHNLTLVRLDGNNLTTISCAVIENKSKLEDLSLSQNYITEISNIEKCPVSIKKLNLSRNSFEQTKSFSHFNNLVSLDLSGNKLSTVDYSMLQDLKFLSYLDLSQNDISALHVGCFKDLENLRELRLHLNCISNLTHGIFGGLKALNKLDLSSNELKNFEEDIFISLRQLRQLDISSNELVDFDVSKSIGHMPGLRTINVDGNSWTCSFLANMIKQSRSVDFLEGPAFGVTNVRGIKCDSSKKTAGEDSSVNSDQEIVSKLNVIIAIMVVFSLVMLGNFFYQQARYCFGSPASLRARFKSKDEDELQLSL